MSRAGKQAVYGILQVRLQSAGPVQARVPTPLSLSVPLRSIYANNGADPQVGLFRSRKLLCRQRQRDVGVPRGPGGPPHLFVQDTKLSGIGQQCVRHHGKFEEDDA